MEETTERQEDLRKKLTPFDDQIRVKWSEIDSWSDRDIEITKLFLLRKIHQQTNRTAKNVAFVTWIAIISLAISIIISTSI